MYPVRTATHVPGLHPANTRTLQELIAQVHDKGGAHVQGAVKDDGRVDDQVDVNERANSAAIGCSWSGAELSLSPVDPPGSPAQSSSETALKISPMTPS